MLIRSDEWKARRFEATTQKFGFVARSGAGSLFEETP